MMISERGSNKTRVTMKVSQFCLTTRLHVYSFAGLNGFAERCWLSNILHLALRSTPRDVSRGKRIPTGFPIEHQKVDILLKISLSFYTVSCVAISTNIPCV